MGSSRNAQSSEITAAVSECRPAVQALVARILRRGREDPDVEDCTHETLRRALESDHHETGRAVRPWVLGIARYVALDALRRHYRNATRTAPTGNLEAGAVSPVDLLADHDAGPEELADHRQRFSRLRERLDALPDNQRDALLLFHVEGLGYREISERLEVPVGTVGTWVLRARQSLATALRSAEEASERGDA